MSVLISVVIPTFNSAATLEKALASIAEQSFQSWEVVCVDGQSTDDTVALLREWAVREPRIRWVSEADAGIYDAMNKGIGRATGEWLLFLGSDDHLHDGQVLADMAAVLQTSPADLVYGDAILLSDGQRYGGEFDVLRLHTVQNLCHQTVFYRKAVFERLGAYNLRYKVLADWDFNIRCFRHPGIGTQHVVREVVVFNNLTGVSSQPYDDPLRAEIPVFYLQELNNLRGNRLLNSWAYAAARRCYGLVRRVLPR